jgi:hypothetical protein
MGNLYRCKIFAVLDSGIRNGIGMEKYFGDWNSREDVVNAFSIDENELKEAVIIAAGYSCESYEGSAMVVFRKNGKLFEVHGSHCSCNGLEDQWSPEEISYEALIDRLNKTQEYMVEKLGSEFEFALRKGLIDEMFEREVLLS